MVRFSCAASDGRVAATVVEARCRLDSTRNAHDESEHPRGLRAGLRSAFMESVHPRHGSHAILKTTTGSQRNLVFSTGAFRSVPTRKSPGAELTVDLPDDMTNVQFFRRAELAGCRQRVDRFMRANFRCTCFEPAQDVVPTATQTDAARIWTLKVQPEEIPQRDAAVIEFVGEAVTTAY